MNDQEIYQLRFNELHEVKEPIPTFMALPQMWDSDANIERWFHETYYKVLLDMPLSELCKLDIKIQFVEVKK